MKTTLFLLLIAVLCSSCIGRTLHERRRRVAGKEYDAYLDKESDKEDEYYHGDYEYEEYGDDYNYNVDMFSCFSGEEQVAYSVMCDGFDDCTDGSDEVVANCEEIGITTTTPSTAATTTTPTTTTTTTTTSTPVTLPPVEPSVRKLEDYGDYDDACTAEEFQCQSDLSICLPQTQVCDGIPDCPDKEDEANCTAKSFDATDQVPTTVVTVSEYPSSENLVGHENRTVAEGKRAPATNIILEGNLCASHNAFQCRSRPGDCVPRALICDGFYDCEDGSDEERCDAACEIGEYSCLNGRCIDASTRCDGTNDCGDFSDEILGCILLPSNEIELEKIVDINDHVNGNNNSKEEKQNGESIPDPDPTITVKYIGSKSTDMFFENEPATTSSEQIVPPSSTVNEESTIRDRSSTSFITEEVDFPICSLHPCANDGECFENRHSFICVCKPGFKGPTCLQKAPIICNKEDPECNSALSSKYFNLLSTITLLILSFLFHLP